MGRRPDRRTGAEARGLWATSFRTSYRRVRIRARSLASSQSALERFPHRSRRRSPDAMVYSTPPTASSGQPALATAAGHHPAKDTGQRSPTSSASPSSSVSSIPATSATPSSSAEPRPKATLSVQMVPYGTETRLLILPRHHGLEEVARMRRDFIPNGLARAERPRSRARRLNRDDPNMPLDPGRCSATEADGQQSAACSAWSRIC